MSGDVLTLGPEDGGREVAVRRGDRVVLRLPENPTTGYRWAGDIPAGLRLARDANEAALVPGAGGVRVFEFVAEAPGRYALALRRSRAWEGPGAAEAEFRLVIKID